jgi:hypothetical protein
MMAAKRTAVWIIATGTFAAFKRLLVRVVDAGAAAVNRRDCERPQLEVALVDTRIGGDVHPLPLRTAAARFNRGQQIK